MSILNSIRQKPDNQKKLFSLVSAIILTLLIVFVWYSFTSNLDSTNMAGEDKPSTLSSLSPLQVIKDEFSKAYDSITGKVSDSVATDTVPIEIVSESLVSSSTENILATSTEDVATSTIN